MTERKLDPIDRIIGVNIRRLRLAQDMSQTQLGELLLVTFQQIQKYEKGINGISAANLARLAVGLKCTMEEFFKRDYAATDGTKSQGGRNSSS